MVVGKYAETFINNKLNTSKSEISVSMKLKRESYMFKTYFNCILDMFSS